MVRLVRSSMMSRTRPLPVRRGSQHDRGPPSAPRCRVIYDARRCLVAAAATAPKAAGPCDRPPVGLSRRPRWPRSRACRRIARQSARSTSVAGAPAPVWAIHCASAARVARWRASTATRRPSTREPALPTAVPLVLPRPRRLPRLRLGSALAPSDAASGRSFSRRERTPARDLRHIPLDPRCRLERPRAVLAAGLPSLHGHRHGLPPQSLLPHRRGRARDARLWPVRCGRRRAQGVLRAPRGEQGPGGARRITVTLADGRRPSCTSSKAVRRLCCWSRRWSSRPRALVQHALLRCRSSVPSSAIGRLGKPLEPQRVQHDEQARARHQHGRDHRPQMAGDCQHETDRVVPERP